MYIKRVRGITCSNCNSIFGDASAAIDPLSSHYKTSMAIHFISDGTAYRNARMTKPALSRSDRHYLRKTTKWVDSIWVYFDTIEHDFRLLHMPMTIK